MRHLRLVIVLSIACAWPHAFPLRAGEQAEIASVQGEVPQDDTIHKYISYGASPRASQYLVLGAKARVMWGEEFEVPKLSAETAGALGGNQTGYGIELRLNDVLLSGAANEGLRIELTAMEDQTQVDSTSLEIHILHDPFEHQNPFPDHELLQEVARISGGQVLTSSADLAAMITNIDVKQGPPIVRKSPLWSNSWMWSVIVGLLTVEWLWRRSVGLA